MALKSSLSWWLSFWQPLKFAPEGKASRAWPSAGPTLVSSFPLSYSCKVSLMETFRAGSSLDLILSVPYCTVTICACHLQFWGYLAKAPMLCSSQGSLPRSTQRMFNTCPRTSQNVRARQWLRLQRRHKDEIIAMLILEHIKRNRQKKNPHVIPR